MNSVFIAMSLDGYIADSHGDVSFLDLYPTSNGDDMGYEDYIRNIDAIIMGRKSFETVLSFNIPWPYKIPVFVWSKNRKIIPKELNEKVKIIQGSAIEIASDLNELGYVNFYIDGGQTIQSFIEADLIEEMTITVVPVILGKGISLFGENKVSRKYKCHSSKVFSNGMVQNKFVRLND